jgi:hypothetical protein
MLINSPNISGSLKVTGNTVITGSLTVLGGINATITGSATSASYVEYSNVANKPTLVSGSAQVSFNGIADKPTLVSGSSQVTYSGLSGIPTGIVSSSTQIGGYGIFATTGSNQFNGSQAITGSLTVTGQVVAQTLNVQQVTSSIVYSSGSNIFGNSLGNTQQFTGSVSVTGSLTVTTNGTELQVTSTGVNMGNALTDSHIISGSLRVNPNGLFVSGSGNVGVGTTSPTDFGSTYKVVSIDGAGGGGVLDLMNTGVRTLTLAVDGGEPSISSRVSGNPIVFKTNNAGTVATRLTIASTGAATFSSSVTAGGNINIYSSVIPSIVALTPTFWGYSSSYPVVMLGSSASASTVSIGYNPSGNANGSFTGNGDEILFRNGAKFTTPNSANNSYYLNHLVLKDGNVGIGTASPTAKLQITNTSAGAATIALFLNNNSTTLNTETRLAFAANTNDDVSSNRYSYISALNTSSSNGQALLFATNETGAAAIERMRITSAGNVGIGTTSPVQKLHVEGSTAIGTTGTEDILLLGRALSGGVSFQQAASLKLGRYQNAGGSFESYTRLDFALRDDSAASNYNTNTTVMTLTNAGNVGIGTTSPEALLHLSQASTGGNGAFIFIDNPASSTLGNTAGIRFATNSGASFSGYGSSIEAVNTNAGDGAEALTFSTWNGASRGERMRITSGGVVLINNTLASPYGVLNTFKTPVISTYVDQIVVQGTGNYPSLRLGTYDAYDGVIATTGNDLRILAGLDVYTEDHNIRFYTSFNGGTGGAQAYERMRITHDNNILFNTTSTSPTNTSSFIFRSGTGAYSGVMIINHATTNNTGAAFIDCYYNTTYIGGIVQNGASNVSFATSSDYRLKQDLKDFNGLNLISNLKVYDFKWKTEDSRMHGVIAHELQEVIPYAVHGNKDEIKENGKIKVQVVDYSKLVPILVKAIQEQQSQIETLKSKIEILEQS